MSSHNLGTVHNLAMLPGLSNLAHSYKYLVNPLCSRRTLPSTCLLFLRVECLLLEFMLRTWRTSHGPIRCQAPSESFSDKMRSMEGRDGGSEGALFVQILFFPSNLLAPTCDGSRPRSHFSRYSLPRTDVPVRALGLGSAFNFWASRLLMAMGML